MQLWAIAGFQAETGWSLVRDAVAVVCIGQDVVPKDLLGPFLTFDSKIPHDSEVLIVRHSSQNKCHIC